MADSARDYHYYVFREGKLIGDFEAMYRNSEEVPWHQDDQQSLIDVRLTREMLSDLKPFSEIHDLGCGLGHYLAILYDMLGSNPSKCFGYDISETACARARNEWPDFEFIQLDLTAFIPRKQIPTAHLPGGGY